MKSTDFWKKQGNGHSTLRSVSQVWIVDRSSCCDVKHLVVCAASVLREKPVGINSSVPSVRTCGHQVINQQVCFHAMRCLFWRGSEPVTKEKDIFKATWTGSFSQQLKFSCTQLTNRRNKQRKKEKAFNLKTHIAQLTSITLPVSGKAKVKLSCNLFCVFCQVYFFPPESLHKVVCHCSPKKKAKLEIWLQRLRYFAAAIAMHYGGGGG